MGWSLGTGLKSLHTRRTYGFAWGIDSWLYSKMQDIQSKSKLYSYGCSQLGRSGDCYVPGPIVACAASYGLSGYLRQLPGITVVSTPESGSTATTTVVSRGRAVHSPKDVPTYLLSAATIAPTFSPNTNKRGPILYWTGWSSPQRRGRAHLIVLLAFANTAVVSWTGVFFYVYTDTLPVSLRCSIGKVRTHLNGGPPLTGLYRDIVISPMRSYPGSL